MCLVATLTGVILICIYTAPCKCESASRVIAYKPSGIYVALRHYDIFQDVIFYGKLNATFHDPNEADFVLNDFAKVGEEIVTLNETIRLTNGTLFFRIYIKGKVLDEYEIVGSEKIELVPLPISIAAYEPHGFSITIPYGNDVEGFVIWANVNTPVVSIKQATIHLSALEPTNGLWMVEEENTKLLINDLLFYNLEIRRNGKIEKYSNLPVLQIKELLPLPIPTTFRATVTDSRNTTSTPPPLLSSVTAEVIEYVTTSTMSRSIGSTTPEPALSSTTESRRTSGTMSTWTSAATSARTTTKPTSTDTTTAPVTTSRKSTTTTPTSKTSTAESGDGRHEKQEQCFREFSVCINAIDPCDKCSHVLKEDSNCVNSVTRIEETPLTPTVTLTTKPRAGSLSTQYTPRNVVYYNDRGTTRTEKLYSETTKAPEARRHMYPYFHHSQYPTLAKTWNSMHYTTPRTYKLFSKPAYELVSSYRGYRTSYTPSRSVIWWQRPTTESRYFGYPSWYSASTAPPTNDIIPNIIAYCPMGLKVTLPFYDGIEDFYFWANINKAVAIRNNATVRLSAFETTNGVWSAMDQQAHLTKGDVLHYIIYVRRQKTLYTQPEKQFLVTDIANNRIGPLNESLTQRECFENK